MSPSDESRYFGTNDPVRILKLCDAFCIRELGSEICEELFHATSVSSVWGFRLGDGQEIVLKVRCDGSPKHLQAVQAVQRFVRASGFPCPEPLVGPKPLGKGTAVVEGLLDMGVCPDAEDPGLAKEIAASLARLIALCQPLGHPPGLQIGPMANPGNTELYYRAPHRHFEFEATAFAAGWIDALARRARELMRRGQGDLVIGHCDWRSEHLRFDARDLVAVYDWDSLAMMRETALVGLAALAHLSDRCPTGLFSEPSIGDCISFVAAYERARGKEFTEAERAAVEAVVIYWLCYDARCQLSDLMTARGTRPPLAPPPFFGKIGRPGVLATHGPQWLARAERVL